MPKPKGRDSPSVGGCWYCYNKDTDLVFDVEFDTWVHKECIEEALKQDPEDPEASLMRYLVDN